MADEAPDTTNGVPSDVPQSSGVSEEPRLIVDKEGYLLRRSAFVDTNDQDKVDVDTGCPGWGGMRPRIGPSRCGELADVILDEEGVHTAEGRPRLISLPPDIDGDFESCRAAFEDKPDRSVVEIPTEELEVGSEFCIDTDLGNLAAVRVEEPTIDALDQLESMTISFMVWARPTGS